jgi:glyoxylase-like metal-dependent hydrolase (beta-lactamase superfamily II)
VRGTGRLLATVTAASALVAASACTHNLHLAPPPPAAAATTTAGPWTSMIFAARTDSGVFVIDLGWGRASSGLRAVLGELGADTADVRYAFLTHAHRDHIGAWPSVTQATFVMGRDEVPRFVGDSVYVDFGSRVGEAFNDSRRPAPGSVQILALGGDTTFVFGRDTLRAYAVPGHTPGSTVYLFRETLFAGDAANHGVVAGFRGALRIFSDDVTRSHASMQALFARFDTTGVRVRTLCTAHAKCAPVDSALRARVTR